MARSLTEDVVDISTVTLDLLRAYGPLALLLFTFLETSLLFPFLPSEVVVPAAAAIVITGPASYLAFIVAAAVGGTVGAFVPFLAFRNARIGRADWLATHLHVSDARLENAQAWFSRWGQSSVLWGRLLPFLRSVVSVPAGVANMGPARFGLYTGVGTVVFYAATGAVVYYVRESTITEVVVATVLAYPFLAILSIVAVAGGAVLYSLRHGRASST